MNINKDNDIVKKTLSDELVRKANVIDASKLAHKIEYF